MITELWVLSTSFDLKIIFCKGVFVKTVRQCVKLTALLYYLQTTAIACLSIQREGPSSGALPEVLSIFGGVFTYSIQEPKDSCVICCTDSALQTNL